MSHWRLGATAVWAATHAMQYGMAITSLNGIQDAVSCNLDHRPVDGGPLKPCIAMSVSGLVVDFRVLMKGWNVWRDHLDIHHRRIDRFISD